MLICSLSSPFCLSVQATPELVLVALGISDFKSLVFKLLADFEFLIANLSPVLMLSVTS